MSYGQFHSYTDSIASGASTSGGIQLSGKPCNHMFVQVGTMSTSAAITMQHAVEGSSTYYNLFNEPSNSATVGTALLTIASSVGTNGGTVFLPHTGLNNIRFITTGVVSGGVQFTVMCSD